MVTLDNNIIPDLDYVPVHLHNTINYLMYGKEKI